MSIVKFITFIFINSIIIILYYASMATIGIMLLELGIFWMIFTSLIGITITRIGIGAILYWLKNQLEKLNPYSKKGRNVVVGLGWLFAVYVLYNVLFVGIETYSWELVFPLLFIGNAFMVLIVNFCYTKYN